MTSAQNPQPSQPVVVDGATLLPDEPKVDELVAPAGFYVQAHDGEGRPVFDDRGQPVLVRPLVQRPGLNAVRTLRWILYVQLALILAALILGIVIAVQLHDLGPSSGL